MNPDETRAYIIKLHTCYQAICQMQKQLKSLDNNSNMNLEQAKKNLLSSIEKCKSKIN